MTVRMSRLALAALILGWTVSAAAAPAGANRTAQSPVQVMEQQYQQRADPMLLFRLGVLAAERGDTLTAQDFMRRFLADPQSNPGPESTAQADQILAAPLPESGELSVSGDKGALVFADGALRGLLPLTTPLLLKTGAHQILIRSGSRSLDARVAIEHGRRLQLRFELSSTTVVVSRPPAVVVLNALDSLPAPEQRRLLVNVERSLERAALAPFQLGVALSRAKDAAGCLETLPCQQMLAERSGLEWVLSLRPGSRRSGAEPAAVEISLVDAQVGDVAATALQPLAAEGSARAGQGRAQALVLEPLLRAIDRVLVDGMSRPRGTLHVESTPPGATIRIGARTLGTSPLEKPLRTGALELQAELPGYKTEKQTVDIADQQVAKIQLLLQPDERNGRESKSSRPRWRIAVGVATIAAGLALIGIGASGVVADGACTSDPIPPMRSCMMLHDSARVGGALIGVGGAAVAGGVILAAWPRRP